MSFNYDHFMDRVAEMRESQRKYKETKSIPDYNIAKELEYQVDVMLGVYNGQEQQHRYRVNIEY